MRFDELVYAVVRQIPRGRVASYGQVALLCGNPRASARWAGRCAATPPRGRRSPATGS